MSKKFKINDKNSNFKDLEKEFEIILNKNKYTIIRLDGRSFSTFTKFFAKPVDHTLRATIDVASHATASRFFSKDLIKVIYNSSDEINIILAPFADTSYPPFAGRINKLISILPQDLVFRMKKFADKFNKDGERIVGDKRSTKNDILANIPDSLKNDSYLGKYTYEDIITKNIQFDCRIVQVKTLKECSDYITWRRTNAISNSKSSFARTKLSHKETLNLSSNKQIELVKELYGKDYYSLPSLWKVGYVYINPNAESEFRTFNEPDEDTAKYSKIIENLYVTL